MLWKNLESKVPDIAKSGFTSAWLPPSTHSFAPEAKYVKEYIEGAKPIFSVGKYWDSCNYNGHGLDYNQGIIWRLRDPQGKPPGVM
ncbi:putative glycosidase [Rosa chinensis]|uniref:Putative glycosidase n=1 Tax=Rosa chinensis TaxID=74649 RepID=A0A2P6PEH7_ROSCH|nr:putative glycosidase [Rosa chinensis]